MTAGFVCQFCVDTDVTSQGQILQCAVADCIGNICSTVKKNQLFLAGYGSARLQCQHLEGGGGWTSSSSSWTMCGFRG